MKAKCFRRWPLAVAIGAVVALSDVTSVLAGPVLGLDGDQPLGSDTHVVLNAAAVAQGQQRYIVRFVERPLALYDGGTAGMAAPRRLRSASQRNKIDVKGNEAQVYLAYLGSQQADHLAAMSKVLARPLPAQRQMRHALNAVVVDMTAAEAARVAGLTEVAAVEVDKIEHLASDLGPGFIGAGSLWWGTPAGQDSLFATGFETTQRYRGEGVVIGVIDTGYNSASPSFANVDDQGYAFVNPLGAGNYVGHCGVAGINTAGCNNKVIGVYDNINATPTTVEDVDGHGSHTGSTSGGNSRSGTLSGYSARLSGVAPRANLVVYFACANNSCPNSATSASVDQAVADGIVDVLSYSISGGTQPWDDSTSLAFLGAANAGIFIAAAAGNTNPTVPNQVAGTVNHYEPWVTSVAAGNHSGGAVGFLMTVTGPGAPPSPIPLRPAVSGVGLAAPVNAALLKASPNFDDPAGGDGCVAYPAGTFNGAVALIKFGANPPCATNARAGNAIAAGATHVVIVANTDGDFSSGANQPVPVWTTSLTVGTLLKDYLSSHAGVTASVSFPAARLPAKPDQLASFSLLGPTSLDLIKPDVQAPGVSILAAIKAGVPAVPAAIGLISGTSMATPHTAGAGALLVGLHPTWTPLEVKSALMMTARQAGLTKANGLTASDPYDRGSGRVQVDVASRAGLVLNESGQNFLNADPRHGGDPSTLNLASLEDKTCVTLTSPTTSANTCTFRRTLRSTLDHCVNWTTSLSGVAGTVVPANFSVAANASSTIDVNVNAAAYASDGTTHFGALVLTPDDGSPALHLPISIAVPAPTIVVPSALNVAIPNGQNSASVNLAVQNSGGPTLNVASTNLVEASPTHVYVAIDQALRSNYGYFNTFYTDRGKGSYASDDFTVGDAGTNLTRIRTPGFTTGAGTALADGRALHFRLYANAAGVPAGAPEATVAHNAAAVWSYDVTLPHAGLSVAGGTIDLDLVAAGAPNTSLAPGTYWLDLYADASYADQGSWAQYTVTAANTTPAQLFGPTWGDTDWGALADYPGLAMHLEYKVACGAPWLTTVPANVSVAGLLSSNVSVTANSTLFGGGNQAAAYLCLQSNDTAHPLSVVRVSAVKI